MPLSSEGKRRIRSLAKRFKGFPADCICTSLLKRARESGEMIARILGKKVVVDPRLNELKWGAWEGKTADELLRENHSAYQQWLENPLRTPPQGESVGSLQKRVRRFLRDCLKRYKNKTVVVVSHGGPIKMLLIEALKLPRKYLFHFRIDVASVTILKFYPQKTQLLCLNNTLSQKIGEQLSYG